MTIAVLAKQTMHIKFLPEPLNESPILNPIIIRIIRKMLFFQNTITAEQVMSQMRIAYLLFPCQPKSGNTA